MENQKKMSLFDLTFMAIGGIIGAGIFSMVGTGIATTGRSVALALLVGMVFTMSQQIRMVFTAGMFQLSGGMYSQNALVLSPFLTGVSAVVTLVTSVSFSVFGISMAQYLSDLFPALQALPDHRGLCHPGDLLCSGLHRRRDLCPGHQCPGYPQVHRPGSVHRLWYHQGADRRL